MLICLLIQCSLHPLIRSQHSFAVNTTSTTPARFFLYLLTLFVLYQMATSLFRALASTFRDIIVAQGVVAFYFLLTQLNSGFINAYPDIPDYWVWYVGINIEGGDQ